MADLKLEHDGLPPFAPSASGASGAPEMMTIEQVAAYLQLHPQVVYRHVRAGTLPASRIGRTIRFKRAVLDAFLEQGAWKFAGAYLSYVQSARARTPVSERTEADGEAPKARFSVDVD